MKTAQKTTIAAICCGLCLLLLTEPLFEELYAEQDSSNLNLIVYSESVQAEGAGDPQEAFQKMK